MESILSFVGESFVSLVAGAVGTVVNVIARFAAACVFCICNILLYALRSLDPGVIDQLMASSSIGFDFTKILVAVGISIATITTLLSALSVVIAPMTGERSIQSPVNIAFRGAFSITCCCFITKFASIVWKGFASLHQSLIGGAMENLMPKLEEGEIATGLVESGLEGYVDGSIMELGVSFIAGILACLLMVIVYWNLLQLILELAQRYAISMLYVFVSPLAIGCSASAGGNEIAKKWFKTLITECVLMSLNGWCVIIGASAIRLASEQAGTPTFAGLTLLAYGILKGLQQLDDIFNSVGANVVRQTGSIFGDLGSMIAAGHSLSAMKSGYDRMKGNMADTLHSGGTFAGALAQTGPEGANANRSTDDKTIGGPQTIGSRMKGAAIHAFEKTALGSAAVGMVSYTVRGKNAFDEHKAATSKDMKNAGTNLAKANNNAANAQALVNNTKTTAANLSNANENINSKKRDLESLEHLKENTEKAEGERLSAAENLGKVVGPQNAEKIMAANGEERKEIANSMRESANENFMAEASKIADSASGKAGEEIRKAIQSGDTEAVAAAVQKAQNELKVGADNLVTPEYEQAKAQLDNVKASSPEDGAAIASANENFMAEASKIADSMPEGAGDEIRQAIQSGDTEAVAAAVQKTQDGLYDEANSLVTPGYEQAKDKIDNFDGAVNDYNSAEQKSIEANAQAENIDSRIETANAEYNHAVNEAQDLQDNFDAMLNQSTEQSADALRGDAEKAREKYEVMEASGEFDEEYMAQARQSMESAQQKVDDFEEKSEAAKADVHQKLDDYSEKQNVLQKAQTAYDTAATPEEKNTAEQNLMTATVDFENAKTALNESIDTINAPVITSTQNQQEAAVKAMSAIYGEESGSFGSTQHKTEFAKDYGLDNPDTIDTLTLNNNGSMNATYTEEQADGSIVHGEMRNVSYDSNGKLHAEQEQVYSMKDVSGNGSVYDVDVRYTHGDKTENTRIGISDTGRKDEQGLPIYTAKNRDDGSSLTMSYSGSAEELAKELATAKTSQLDVTRYNMMTESSRPTISGESNPSSSWSSVIKGRFESQQTQYIKAQQARKEQGLPPIRRNKSNNGNNSAKQPKNASKNTKSGKFQYGKKQ